jgi:hypothetical protein
VRAKDRFALLDEWGEGPTRRSPGRPRKPDLRMEPVFLAQAKKHPYRFERPAGKSMPHVPQMLTGRKTWNRAHGWLSEVTVRKGVADGERRT